jgi:glucosamine-6-phosphate deaminase
MLVAIVKTYADLSREAARIVANAIKIKPDLRLGLATGQTPLGMYRELIRLYDEGTLKLSQVVTFNLDEYIGLAPDHPQSYHSFMHENFFRHVDVDPKNIHIPDGTIRADFETYCEGYEESIRRAGGIDLQIVGIGKEGHIGFNEPASSLASRTRVKTLTSETIAVNRRFFQNGEAVPECAITMGIGTILTARKVLLLASGGHKAEAVAKAIEGPLTASVTASALQLHPDATAVVDEEAAARLRGKDYYRRVMLAAAKLTPNRLW